MGLGLFYAIVTGVCWAVLAIGLKNALHFSSTGTIAWARMAWAFVVLALIFAIGSRARLRKILTQTPKLLILSGVMLSTNYFAYMRGLEYTSAANAQIMIQLGPLLFLIIGVWYYREKLVPLQWLGVAIAGAGFLLFYWDQFAVVLGARRYVEGTLWVVLAAVTWALFAAFQKYLFSRGWLPQEQNLFIYAFATLALAPLAEFNELTAMNFNQHVLMFLLGMNTLVAYGAFAEANQRAPAAFVSLIISCNPLITIALLKVLEHMGSTFVSPEPINSKGYIGAILVVGGVGAAMSLGRRSRSVKVP